MADQPPDTPTTVAAERVQVTNVTQDKVTLEFLVEDLIHQLVRPVQVAACKGCMGCMASRF